MHGRSTVAEAVAGGAARTAAVAIGVAIAASAGCAVDGGPALAPAGEADQAISGPPSGGQCPSFGCGTNSPMIDTFEFHDFSLVDPTGRGLTIANDAGFSIQAVRRIAQIVQRGTSYNLRVKDGRISGTTCTTVPCTTISGTGLIGAWVPVVRGESHYAVLITDVRPLGFFLGGGQTETYAFKWVDASGSSFDLCNNIPLLEQLIAAQPGGLDGPFANQELMGMHPWEAVVFEGDRIDSNAKTMSPDAMTDDRWFNVGCAGHALAKLRLTRNTVHSQLVGIPQPWVQRQATLKMLVADYCKTGVPFTVAGQRLVWTGDLMGYFSSPMELEARWAQDGPQCLYQPRMLHPTSSLGATTFPDILKAIQTTCPTQPTPCTNLDFNDFDGMPRMSANPKP